MTADEYTPTTEVVRTAFMAAVEALADDAGHVPDEAKASAAFDRWLAGERARVLREAAGALVRAYPMRWAMTGRYPHPGYDAEQAENAANAVILGLRDRADRIEREVGRG